MSLEESRFIKNVIPMIETEGMRILPFNTINNRIDDTLNPYRRYSDYRMVREQYQTLLLELIKQGTILPEGNRITNEMLGDDIVKELKPHQQRLVWEMKRYENCPYTYTTNGRYGFLCDKVGTGKSLSILALIAANKNVCGGKQYKVPYITPIRRYDGSFVLPTGLDYTTYQNSSEYKFIRSTLIVVPHSIISQWIQYINDDTNLSCYVVNTRKKIDLFLQELPMFVEKPEDAPDIVLVKSSIYNKFTDSINTVYQEPEYKQEPYVPETTSQDFMSHELPNIVREIRITYRGLLRTAEDFRVGNVTKQSFAKKMMDLVEYFDTKKDIIRTAQEDTTVTHGKILNYVIKIKKGLVWNRVVYDEADTIAIGNANRVWGRVYWLVTASYPYIIKPLTQPPPHRTGFIRGAIDSQVRQQFYLQHCIYTNELSFLERGFSLPDIVETKIECFTSREELAASAADMENVLEAIQAGDTSGAIALCGISENSSESGIIERMEASLKNDIQCVSGRLESNRRRLERVNESINEVNGAIGELGDISSITEPDTLLRYQQLLEGQQVLNRNKIRISRLVSNQEAELDSLDRRLTSMVERVKESLEQDCPICMEKIPDGKKAVLNCCSQTFCVDCLMQQIAAYRHRTTTSPCPNCRADLTMDSFTVLKSKKKEETDSQRERLPYKQEALKTLLDDPERSQVLLFSNHDGSFEQCKSVFDAQDIKYAILDGSSGAIQNKIKKWKNGKLRVLCLHAQNLGTGLNLQAATDLVIYHKIKQKALDKQIIGRAQRPGREVPLRVWRLQSRIESQ